MIDVRQIRITAEFLKRKAAARWYCLSQFVYNELKIRELTLYT